jgi:hypothetical protein
MRFLLAALAVVLLAPGLAHGATVAYTHIPSDYHYPSDDIVDVVGDDANDRLTATIGPEGVDLADATALLTVTALPAGLPNVCAAVDEHQVHCTVGSGTSTVRLDGGAGADAITVVQAPGWTATPGQLTGGAGDDVLTGSDGTDYLDGGPGRDVVRALGGDDHLKAENLDDGDVLDGGAGADELTVGGAGLTADLAAGGIVGAGLAATLTGVETVTVDPDSVAFGTDGPDRLGGGRLLDGRGGDDAIIGTADHPQVLRGGEGDDIISYGPGDDVEAGPGDDILDASGLGGRAYAVNCGPGVDLVNAAGNDVAARDCEWVAGDRFRVRNAVRAAAHGTALRLTVSALRPGCGVEAHATQPGVREAITPVVHVRHPVRPGVPFTVSLPLRPNGRRLLAQGLLRAPRVVLRRPLRGCPAHGRWTADPGRGVPVRLADAG